MINKEMPILHSQGEVVEKLMKVLLPYRLKIHEINDLSLKLSETIEVVKSINRRLGLKKVKERVNSLTLIKYKGGLKLVK